MNAWFYIIEIPVGKKKWVDDNFISLCNSMQVCIWIDIYPSKKLGLWSWSWSHRCWIYNYLCN